MKMIKDVSVFVIDSIIFHPLFVIYYRFIRAIHCHFKGHMYLYVHKSSHVTAYTCESCHHQIMFVNADYMKRFEGLIKDEQA